MIFKQWEQVLGGTKTQTRRLVKVGDVFVTWEVLRGEAFYIFRNSRKLCQIGCIYAIQPGRGKKAVGRFLLVEIRREWLQDISFNDMLCEGYPIALYSINFDKNPTVRDWFISLWDSINKKPGTRWADNPEVWVRIFEVEK